MSAQALNFVIVVVDAAGQTSKYVVLIAATVVAAVLVTLMIGKHFGYVP